MRRDIERTLMSLQRPLYGRCRKVAAQLRPDATGDSPEELAQELWSAALLAFVEREKAGWFDQGPTRTNLEARVAHLFVLMLRDLATTRRRELARVVRLAPGDDAEDGADPLETRFAAPVEEPSDTEDARTEEQRAALAGTLESALTPPLVLALLVIHYPQRVERRHFEAAADFRRGARGTDKGFFLRDVGEAWQLFDTHRRDPALVDDRVRWRRALTEMFRATGPWGATDAAVIASRANYLEKALSKAKKKLEERTAAVREEA